MGLLDRLRGGAWVAGTYTLVACSYPSGGAAFENCSMDGVVEAPGVAPTAVHHVSLITPVAKWPQPGAVLPVLVDPTNPMRVKVQWKALPTTGQRARAAAQQAAADAAARAAANAGGTAAAGGSTAGMPSTGAPGFGMPGGAAAFFTAAGLGPQMQAMLDAQARAAAAGAGPVVGGRPAPGVAGGGLTPAESAFAAAGGGAELGLIPTVATVLAAHPALPPGSPDPAPGGTWDLALDVAGPAAGAGWTSILRIGFSTPQRQADICRTGRSLPVLADPDRHDRIAVDTDRLDQEARGS